MGLCVTKQADQHKHARHRGIVVICENDGSDKRVFLREFTHHVCFFFFFFSPQKCDTVAYFRQKYRQKITSFKKKTQKLLHSFSQLVKLEHPSQIMSNYWCKYHQLVTHSHIEAPFLYEETFKFCSDSSVLRYATPAVRKMWNYSCVTRQSITLSTRRGISVKRILKNDGFNLFVTTLL